MITDKDVHAYIETQERVAEKLLGQDLSVAYRGASVAISGWVGGEYMVANGLGMDSAIEKFREFFPHPAELRRRAAEMLAKAEAMEAGK
jgi:hypothetical protein